MDDGRSKNDGEVNGGFAGLVSRVERCAPRRLSRCSSYGWERVYHREVGRAMLVWAKDAFSVGVGWLGMRKVGVDCWCGRIQLGYGMQTFEMAFETEY